jgi:hypothetical protein
VESPVAHAAVGWGLGMDVVEMVGVELGSCAALKTDCGIGTGDGVEGPVARAAVGWDLGMDVVEMIGVPRGAGLVYTDNSFSNNNMESRRVTNLRETGLYFHSSDVFQDTIRLRTHHLARLAPRGHPSKGLAHRNSSL